MPATNQYITLSSLWQAICLLYAGPDGGAEGIDKLRALCYMYCGLKSVIGLSDEPDSSQAVYKKQY